MKIKSFVIAMFLISFTFSTQAQVSKKKVVKTQVNQQKRIHQGVRSGELTKKETVQLQRQQARIQRTKKRAASDGIVTRKEKAVIRSKQANASKRIAKKKHN